MDSITTKNKGLSSSLPSSSVISWVHLPEDILQHILDLASLTISEFIRFGAVCKTWYHVFLQKKKSCKEFSPMILIPSRNNNKPLSDMVVFNVFENKYYTKYFKACKIPENGISCLSCSYNWWAIVGSDSRITLVNPFPEISKIYLPAVQDLKLELLSGISKVVLSSNPLVDQDNYMVAFMGKRILRCIKSGEKLWTVFNPSGRIGIHSNIVDILFHQDQLFVSYSRHLVIFDCRCDNTSTRHNKLYDLLMPFPNESAYIVDSLERGLLLVHRRKPDCFKVYKMHTHDSTSHPRLGSNNGIWIRTKKLGKDEAIIWDEENLNFRCILASEYPNSQPNSIYYVEYGKGPQEVDHMRSFKVKSKRVSQ